MIKFFAIDESSLIEPQSNDVSDIDHMSCSENRHSPEVLSKEKEEFRIRKLYEKALELQMQSQYNELINLLQEILLSSIMTDNQEITSHMKVVKTATYKLLANTHRKLNNYNESYTYYAMAIKMSSPDLNLFYGLAVTCERMNKWDEAVTAYERVLNINSGHWPSLDALIVLTFSLVEFEKSAQYCMKALYLDTQYDTAIYVLQRIFTYQPSLKTLLQQFLVEIPNVLTDLIDKDIVTKLSSRVDAIKDDIAVKRALFDDAEKIRTIEFYPLIGVTSWDELAHETVKQFLILKKTNMLDSMIDMPSPFLDSSNADVAEPIFLNVMESEGLWLCDNVVVTDVTELNDGIHALIDDYIPKDEINLFRVTRNSSQMFDGADEKAVESTEHNIASLIRMNILNEVHAMANEKFKEYDDMVSKKREIGESTTIPDNTKYQAKSLNNDSKDLLVQFMQSFHGRKVTIVEIAWQLLKYLITKEYFIWSSQLVDDYITLSNLVRIHVSSQIDESPMETLISIKRLLFEVECLLDRKQSELEGKLHKSDKEFKYCDFVPQKCVDEFSNRIMKLQIRHGEEFEKELTIIQIRVLWIGYILADMFQNEVEVRLYLDCLQRCLFCNNIAVHMRPNCLHHSVITMKKIDDCLSASIKTLKVDALCELYKKEQYDQIIEKTNNIIGAVVLPKEDYAEDMNNYMIKISFNCSSYHKILSALLRDNIGSIDRDYLVKVYSDTTSVLEEITNIVDILKDPIKKNHNPVTDRQMCFLTDNYFKVAKILLTNATNLLKLMDHHNLNMIELIGVEQVSRFIVLAKEYFYHSFCNSITEINVAHIWCLYTHFKSLELFDPFRYNQSVTYKPNEELDLPPSLNFLSLVHDYMGAKAKCAQCDGALLKLIITAVCEYIEEIRPKFRKLGVFLANHSDVLSILDQALYCIRPVQRPDIDKFRKPIDHGSTGNVTINLALVDLLLTYLEPGRVPEVDSVKNLSISADLNSHFIEIISFLPESIFANAHSELSIKQVIHNDEPLGVRFIPKSRYSQLFYFVADHYFKNNEFEKALDYYISNLRFTPNCFDTWAAIALIYYKRLEDKFNMMDNSCESLTNDEVVCCLNSFNHAISLDPDNLTILVEKGCFCYEVHSYASRMVKKSLVRDVSETLVKDCQHWSKLMLEHAKECYDTALETDGYREEKDEKWLYYYMLSKCMEKSEENTLLEVLDQMEKAMNTLDSCGAKYVRKIVFYTKIPFRAVEAVEVYYKYHATILKFLLRNQASLLSAGMSNGASRLTSLHPSKSIDHSLLLEIQQLLISMSQSPFITNVGKIKNTKTSARKRMSTKSEDSTEPVKILRLSPNVEVNTDVIDVTNIPPELRYEDNEDECIVQEVVLPSQSEDTKSVYERCIDLCRASMEVVLQRLPLHYKAIYHLAYIHSFVPHIKNIEKSYEYLMGSSKSGKSTINGLFKDRKISNFFHGIWRIPVADIDRNGSFAYHMYRSMNLLMTVLRQMNAWKDLCSINTILRKSAADRRGFLSNGDRQMLIRKSMGHSVYAVNEWLTKYEGDVCKEDLVVIQSLYLAAVKQGQGIEKMRAVLQEAFCRCVVAMEHYGGHMVDGNDEKNGDVAARVTALNMATIDKVVNAMKEQKK